MKKTRLQRNIGSIGLVLGPGLGLLTFFVLGLADGLGHQGRVVAALAVLMAVWWLTEALPIPATSLLPLAVLPLATGGEIGIREAASSYSHDLIFLYMGGFMLALTMQRWGLHRRIALATILLVGTRPRRIVLGFMLSSAALSMWISNTATVVMMLPIALSVIDLVRRQLAGSESERAVGESFPFAISLLLGTAYAASIGGIATLLGTPPNGLLAAFVRDSYGQEISMFSWLPIGLAVSIPMLPLAWWLLVRVVFPVEIAEIPGGRALIRGELEKLGRMSTAERRMATVFVLTAVAWVVRPWLNAIQVGDSLPLAGLNDSVIAMVAALVLFLLPSGEGRRLLDWPTAVELPWGILLLFGGGLSLASAVRSAGVDSYIGQQVAGLGSLPAPVLVVLVTALVIFLTEMTSNTATTATFLPIMGAVAEGLGMEPLMLLIPLTLAASCAFMMPVATPPNAIVFGSGEISISQMCRAGLWLNLAATLWIVVVVYFVAKPLLGL